VIRTILEKNIEMEITTNNWIKKITLMSLVLLGVFSAASAKGSPQHYPQMEARQQYVQYLQSEIIQTRRKLAALELTALKYNLHRRWTQQSWLNYKQQRSWTELYLLKLQMELRRFSTSR